ncbi:FERM domain-containing protein 4B-like [Limulus polyphemus]|uniref:FERM domain-containing protein 4B-like n=1 Tax=Limulus polyphemus TaxID=6850 RepID=A0ABM1B6C8_LIMPO|nr:FERM domain-containing protein 4B-like [Limulus polyphemus]
MAPPSTPGKGGVWNHRILPVIIPCIQCSYVHLYKMAEGKRSQVVLLDNHNLDILIQPKLYAGELLDMVASHFSLKEKEYFGLAFLDDT